MLHGDLSIPVTFMAFDVLAVEGFSVMSQRFEERRSLLETLVIERRGFSLSRHSKMDERSSMSSLNEGSKETRREAQALLAPESS
jgi:ATP-dependent DNA ligase